MINSPHYSRRYWEQFKYFMQIVELYCTALQQNPCKLIRYLT